jgi:2'-5' RNA ligase
MWNEAASIVQAGGAPLDAQLACLAADARRGVTLLARPGAAVADALSSFLEQFRVMEPKQYYQPASDLHHTVLSLFTATADYAPYLSHLPAYREAVAEVAGATPPFTIGVRGVTLTRGGVLAQGFPLDHTLAGVRERLRAALGARGLGDALDRRYRLVTAHMTLIRFGAPLRDRRRFVTALAGARATEFRATHVDCLELVFGDWYHTAAREQSIERYRLEAPAQAPLGSTAR